MDKFKLVEPPDKDAQEKNEKHLDELYGECNRCKNHDCICRMCGITGMPLVYPIHGCPKRDVR